ncbi:amino-acid carrier protein [Acrasis kona]|uniref:Amino-acid carrier protein n=1 Tax=Acrasis kona TaxID=1008807 RepID=A0AAW2ZMP3_9EUKA
MSEREILKWCVASTVSAVVVEAFLYIVLAVSSLVCALRFVRFELPNKSLPEERIQLKGVPYQDLQNKYIDRGDQAYFNFYFGIFLIFMGAFTIVRFFQCILFIFLCINEEVEFISLHATYLVLMSSSNISLLLYFVCFTCFTFQWAQVIKQSEADVNGFIVTKSFYKLHFILVNAFVIVASLATFILHFVPDFKNKRWVEFSLMSIVAICSLIVLLFMCWLTYKVIKILKRQWVIPEYKNQSVYDLKILNVSSEKDRNRFTGTMLCGTLLLCTCCLAHFCAVLVLIPIETPFWSSLLVWLATEILPGFFITAMLSFRNNYEKAQDILYTLAHGTNGM